MAHTLLTYVASLPDKFKRKRFWFMLTFWKTVAAALAETKSVFVSLVVASSRGSPGSPGARILVLPDGSQTGTIGGGALESRTLQRALVALRSGQRAKPATVYLQHFDPDHPNASGLRCGGSQTNVELILHRDLDLAFTQRVAMAEAGRFGAVLRLDQGGMQLLEQAPDHLQCRIRWQDGTDWNVHLPLNPAERAVVMGGGHCGAALARILHDLDFAVTIVEPRGPIPTLLSLPEGIARLHSSWDEAVSVLSCTKDTVAVVMTHGLSTDIEALAALLPLPLGFLGVMGSPKKIALIHEALASRGFDARQRESIAGPVGLLLKTDTPAEIAVSVAAQLLDRRRTWRDSIKRIAPSRSTEQFCDRSS